MPASTPDAIPGQLDASQFHSEFGYFAPTIGFRRKIALTIKATALGTFLGAVATFFMVMDREEKAVTMLAAPMVSLPPQAAVDPKVTVAPKDTAAPKVTVAHKPGAVLFVPQSLAFTAAAPGRSAGWGVTAAVAAPVAVPVTPEPPTAVAIPTPMTPAIATPTAAPAAIAPAAIAPAAIVAPEMPAAAAPAAVAPPAAPVVAAAPVHAPVKVVARPKKKVVREPRQERIVVMEPEPPQSFAGPFRRFAEPSYGRPLFGFGR